MVPTEAVSVTMKAFVLAGVKHINVHYYIQIFFLWLDSLHYSKWQKWSFRPDLGEIGHTNETRFTEFHWDIVRRNAPNHVFTVTKCPLFTSALTTPLPFMFFGGGGGERKATHVSKQTWTNNVLSGSRKLRWGWSQTWSKMQKRGIWRTTHRGHPQLASKFTTFSEQLHPYIYIREIKVGF